MSEKDILDGETCELIAAQSVERGFKSEWLLTLRYEGHSFQVKAFAEHGRMIAAAGLRLPERYEGKREYTAPYSVVIGHDESRNERRVVGVFNQYGELHKLENYLDRKTVDLDLSIELEKKEREIRRLEGELQALRNSIANKPIQSPAKPLDSLKNNLDALFTQYPESSTQRALVAMMLMNLPHLQHGAALVAAPKKKWGK